MKTIREDRLCVYEELNERTINFNSQGPIYICFKSLFLGGCITGIDYTGDLAWSEFGLPCVRWEYMPAFRNHTGLDETAIDVSPLDDYGNKCRYFHEYI